MGRTKNALNVSELERDQIRRLFVQGVRVADIARRMKRGESTVTAAVKGLKRPRRHRPRHWKRNARMLEMRTQGLGFRRIGDALGMSTSSAFDIVSTLTGKPRQRRRVRTETSKLPPTKRSRPRLTREQRTRRNATITKLWLDGVSYAKLTHRFMLGGTRVRTIVRLVLARRGLQPRLAPSGPRTVRLRGKRRG